MWVKKSGINWIWNKTALQTTGNSRVGLGMSMVHQLKQTADPLDS